MKVKVNAVVLRDKRNNEILDVIPIGDVYDETYLEYPAGLFTLEEFIEWAKDRGYTKPEEHFTQEIANIVAGKGFYSQCEAKNLPSIGNALVSREEKEFDWA